MLTKMNIKVDLDPIIQQVQEIQFEKSITINYTNDKLLNGPYQLKPEFVNTPLGNAIELMGNIGEARLLKLESAESYTAHADPDDRIHLAIVTNQYSYIIDLDNNTMHHLPANGEVWHMDTGVTHVATNFGAKARIHLNIRVPLPPFVSPGYSLKVSGGDYDWKQESYMTVMSFFNRAIKENIITGFEKVSDREVLINCDPTILDRYITALTTKGFSVSLTPI
jgi:hypothetical protein